MAIETVGIFLKPGRPEAAEIVRSVEALAAAGRNARGHILNLGHGCLPDTPVEGVRAFTAAARGLAG